MRIRDQWKKLLLAPPAAAGEEGEVEGRVAVLYHYRHSLVGGRGLDAGDKQNVKGETLLGNPICYRYRICIGVGFVYKESNYR
jgi:hypothetical protein